MTDPALALATCTAGGRLLPPSRPASPLDISFWPAAQPKSRSAAATDGRTAGQPAARPSGSTQSAAVERGGASGGDVPRLLGTYSNVSGHLWQYVVAVDTPQGSVTALLSDLHWPLQPPSPPSPLVTQYALHHHGASCNDGAAAFAPAGCATHVTSTTQIDLFSSPGTPHANGTHGWGLFLLAPRLEGGEPVTCNGR